MRLVIARCSVDYVGRLDAHLPMADRLLLLKADGSVSVHADDRAYKPLNWMTPPCTLEESEIKDIDGEPTGEYLWLVENKKGDQLRITIEEIHQDIQAVVAAAPPFSRYSRSGNSESTQFCPKKVQAKGLAHVKVDDRRRRLSLAIGFEPTDP